MSPDKLSLERLEGEIRWIKKMTAQMEANGLIDKLPTYGTLTNRQRLDKDLVRCQRIKTELTQKIRFDRVMSRWHRRQLDRPGTPASGTARSWFRPMRVDDVIQDRRVIEHAT